MVAVVAMKPSATVKDNAAVKVFVEGFEDGVTQEPVSLLKPRFPLTLKFVAVVVDEAVKRSVFNLSAIVTTFFVLICVPLGFHI